MIVYNSVIVLLDSAVTMILWNNISPPTTDCKLKTVRDFVKNHKLCIKTAGKGRTKIRIIEDINQILKYKKIPKDVLSHLLTFLDLKDRVPLSCISKVFQECVIFINKKDKTIAVTVSVHINDKYKCKYYIYI